MPKPPTAVTVLSRDPTLNIWNARSGNGLFLQSFSELITTALLTPRPYTAAALRRRPEPWRHISFCLNSDASSLSNFRRGHLKRKRISVCVAQTWGVLSSEVLTFLYLFALMRTAIGVLFVAAFARRGLARSGHSQRKVGGTADFSFTATFYSSDGKWQRSRHVIRTSTKPGKYSTNRKIRETSSHFAEAQHLYAGLLLPRNIRPQPYQKSHFMTWSSRALHSSLHRGHWSCARLSYASGYSGSMIGIVDRVMRRFQALHNLFLYIPPRPPQSWCPSWHHFVRYCLLAALVSFLHFFFVSSSSSSSFFSVVLYSFCLDTGVQLDKRKASCTCRLGGGKLR